MWSPLRLDINWLELIRALTQSSQSDRRLEVQNELELFWSNDQQDSLACLSVRSGFDLLLQALQLPDETEVLFSAINIPAMAAIARAHGLQPVPVDVCNSDYRIDMAALRKACTPKSRVLVVAHLLGARLDLAEVAAFANENNLLLVEDCAQAWYCTEWRGSELANVSLFSFGPIKTATALGGAMCRVADSGLLNRMRSIQQSYPVQRRAEFFKKCFRFAVLKLCAGYWPYTLLSKLADWIGVDLPKRLGQQTRGFPTGDPAKLLRHQPSVELLRLMSVRFQTYDDTRIQRRVANAHRIISNLGLKKSQPELLMADHTFWLFPLITENGDALIKHLHRRGFEATMRGRLEVIRSDLSHINHPQATASADLLKQTVFLPCYAEMSDAAIDRMCREIQAFWQKPRSFENHP